MLFEKKTDYIFPRETNAYAFGAAATFDIPRELPIESMYLRVSFKNSTAPTAYGADGPLGFIRKIQLSGADGARTRNVIDASGAGLIELSKHWTGYTDHQTGLLLNSNRTAGTYSPTPGTGDRTFVVPMHFALPNLDDPVASAFLLPVDRYNANPQMTVQIGSTTDIASDVTQPPVQGTVTGAAGAGVVLSLVINRRIVNRLNWPIVDAEIGELSKTASATIGDNQDFDIPITGYYTALLLRTYLSAAAKGDVSHATLLTALLAHHNNPWRLELSGNTIRRFRLSDVEVENDLSEAHGSAQGDILAGSYLLDFLSDRIGGDSGDVNTVFGSLLNANIPLNSGARLVLRQNIQVASAPIKYLYHRFYANLKDLKL